MTTVEITCLIGQSNASGIALENQLLDAHQNAFDDAYVYNFNTNKLENLEYGVNNQLSQPSDYFGMEMAWGELAPQLSDNMQVLIKQAYGGASLYNEWNVANNGEQYLAFCNQLDNAISMLEEQGYDVKIKTVIQASGENDSVSFDSSSAFKDNQLDLINTIYNDYDDYMDDATWVLTEMRSPYYQYVYADEILVMQQEIATNDSRVEIVNTEGAEYREVIPTGIHYNTISIADIAREALRISYDKTQNDIDALNLDDGSNIVISEHIPEIKGTNGDDVLQGNWVVGYDGNDTIFGTNDGNKLFGLEGDDTINGSGGDDIIVGGFGNDYLYGSIGNDTLYGEEGDDQLLGAAGNDTIYGGKDNDIINGDAGDDLLFGDEGNDYINGRLDNDIIYGGTGDDNLHGGLGNDNIYGEDGNDYIRGGDGDDAILGGDGRDSIYCDEGKDYATGGNDRDWIFGGAGNDSLSGGDGNDYIDGGDDTDYIKGDGGNDTILGGDGRDNIFGNSGNDTLTGGDAWDFFIFSAGDGTDTITDFAYGDKICFYNISDFAELSFVDIGSDVEIHAGDVTIIMLNTEISDFDTGDFSFL